MTDLGRVERRTPRMPEHRAKSLWYYLYRSFASVHGWVLAVLGGLGSILFPVLGGSLSLNQVGITIASFLIATMLIALVVFIHATITLWHDGNPGPSRVVHAQAAPRPYEPTEALLLAESHPQLTRNASVSIFVVVDGVEVLTAVGRVLDIQEDARVQLLATSPFKDNERWQSLIDGSKDSLARIHIRAGIPDAIRENTE